LNDMQVMDIADYQNIINRHDGWILGIFVLCLVLTALVIRLLLQTSHP
jgi:uncharacterized protein involved in exopolysaccharide biosynthesis